MSASQSSALSRKLEIPNKLKPLITEQRRFKVIHGGRGGAKSWTVARILVLLAASKSIRVLCARETQKSINDSVHKLIKDQIELLGLQGNFNVTENRITSTTGSEFSFAGIRQQSITNIKSFEGVDICWVEEGQVVSKKSWDVLTPTIRKENSEIWITFNPELDTDETWMRFVENAPSNALVIQCNWSDNPWFSETLNSDRLACLKRDPIGYENIWEGKCRTAVDGAIYANEISKLVEEQRLCNAPYDPLLKVHTVWDLGFNDSMAIAFVQRTATGEVRIIDYIEDSHRTLDSYISDIRERKWNWGMDFLPHDAHSKDFKSGKSTEQIVHEMGRNPIVLGRENVEDGIKVARMMLGRVWFDRRATALVNRLKRYRRVQHVSTGEFGAPLHDENSHGADCFRYIAMAESQMHNDTWGGKIDYPDLGY